MPTTPTPESQQQLRDQLAMHVGSQSFFRHWTRQLIYTEGVQFLAEQARAYWLIDLVASWRLDPRIRGEEFVVWRLSVNEDRTATAIADDGNNNELVRQEIEFTDFPLPEITLYLTDHTLLLPSEY